MNNIRKLVTSYRIVKIRLFITSPIDPCFSFTCRPNVYNLSAIGARNMAQKSITSFFKITPKKGGDGDDKEEKQNESPSETSELNKNKLLPVTNGKETKTSKSKRSRSNSSSSENDSPKPTKRKSSPPDSGTKKKSKRLRIESSSSEEGSPKQNVKIEETKTAKSPIKPKKETSPSEKQKEKKVKEKSPLVESNGKDAKEIKSKKKVSKKKSSDGEKESSEVKGSSPKDSSPKKVKVKEEKASPEKKKAASNVMSFFVKKEVNGKSDGAKQAGLVAEEEYNPAKSKYDPVQDACWAKGEPVPYIALAKTLEAIEGTSSRLKIVEILGNYFRSVIALTPEDLLPSVYMCLNQLAPAYHSLELGIAETYLMKAIGQCTGQTLAQVKSAAAKSGDLGEVAMSARAKQRTMMAPPKLILRKVFAALKEIAHMTGSLSVNKKISKIQTLYVSCRWSEAKFLIRSLEGKLRIGLAEQSVLQALAHATVLTPPGPQGEQLDAAKGWAPDKLKAKIDEQALIIKTTYCECPNYDLIIPAMLEHGVPALPLHCRLTPGIPLKPMLAHPTKGIHEIFNRFENEQFTCEWKYDGERAQIHVPSKTESDDQLQADFAVAKIFSRNQEDNTSKYPDIVRRLPALLNDTVKSCVLDTEAVAYDVENKQILPFQILSTRKRKDASEADIKVQVCVFAFDLLYLNGEPLVKMPLATRRDLLREHFNEVPGEWQFASGADCSSLEEVQALLDESIKGSCEGLMVKMLHGANAKYDIARRSHNWLKLKKDYLEGVGDTIDCVVLGGYLGRGKRAGAYGGFLLACYDDDNDEYQALCKIGTGFSDEDLQSLTETLKQHVIDGPKSYYRYDPSHAPSSWFSASCVWEVRCADLSLSPSHRAAIGLVDPDKGISLRFPRFVRVRTDKTPEQATTARQIADMYLAQDQVKNQINKTNVQDDFY